MMLYTIKNWIRLAITPLIYRYPPFGLAPERLYLYLHYLIDRRDVTGGVVEVGCHLGGTAVVAVRAMKGVGISKKYTCIDTFDSFVPSQFAQDVALGTPQDSRRYFMGNSRQLVSKIVAYHNCGDIELIEGDIGKLSDRMLPERVSVALVDVDLAEPTHIALSRLYPRLEPGGVILVDDCFDSAMWKARLGYSKFCNQNGITEKYQYGMGILERKL
jgi:O-methyltransferase